MSSIQTVALVSGTVKANKYCPTVVLCTRCSGFVHLLVDAGPALQHRHQVDDEGQITAQISLLKISQIVFQIPVIATGILQILASQIFLDYQNCFKKNMDVSADITRQSFH